MRFDEDGHWDDPSVPAEAVGHTRLWAAVLRQGLSDAAAALRATRATSGRVKLPRINDGFDAEASLFWLEADDTHVGSLPWLCELFGIDITVARGYVYENWRTLE